jgi:hypothetical protein
MKPPKITPELRQAVDTFIMAQAYAKAVKPIVRKYQQDVLDANDFHYSAEWSKEYTRNGEPLAAGRCTDIDSTYLMDDEDAAKYFALLDIAKEQAGFVGLPAGNCPLLMAEYDVIKARWAIAHAAEYITTETGHTATCDAICAANKLTEYTDLIVGLVLSLDGRKRGRK